MKCLNVNDHLGALVILRASDEDARRISTFARVLMPLREMLSFRSISGAGLAT